MAIDFEEFLNKALDEGSKEKDLLELEEDSQLEENEVEEIINPISIQPLLDQISNLKEKAISSPERFQEVYEKFEEFEKLYPHFFIDIQSKLYENQSVLKKQYLEKVLANENSKIENIKKEFDLFFEKIHLLIEKLEFKKAHDALCKINYEIIQIPKSQTNLKLTFVNRLYEETDFYYKTLSLNREELSKKIIDSIIYIIKQKNLIFSTINRSELDELIQDVQTLFLKKRVEIDGELAPYMLKMLLFNSKIIEHRSNIQKKCEEEFEKFFNYLEKQYKEKIKQHQLYTALVILEMAHILLKKETKYNQDLKIKYFLKLLEFKKEINTMSYSHKKAFNNIELSLSYSYSILNLIKLTHKSIIRYSNTEIEEITSQVQKMEYLTQKHKSVIIEKIKKYKHENKPEKNLIEGK